MELFGSLFLLCILGCIAHGRILREETDSPLSIIVKRQAEQEDLEPELSTSVAPTDSSLLDIFSSSSKEKKPAKAIIQSVHSVSNVTLRYAKTLIESKILNPAEVAQEVFFDVIIPETSFISGFSMEIDGTVYNAYVKEKEEAQKVYDTAVKQGITAGHVKQSVRDSNRFSVSVNVEPQKKVRFNLTYEELLQRKYGLYRHIVNLNPGQIVEDLSVEVYIQENKNVTNVKVPEFQSGNDAYWVLESEDFDLAVIERISPTEVKVSFRPTVEDQKKLRKKPKGEADANLPEGMSGQFAVEYDVARDPDGGEILVNDGYFVHFFAPPDLPPLKKHIVFVLDVSGSMNGRKIEQLKQAMSSILSELNPSDYFNIIEFAFSATVRDLDSPVLTLTSNPWIINATESADNHTKVKPFPATPEYIKKGKEVVEKMTAAGGTNIYDALNIAIDIAKTEINHEIAKRSAEEDLKFRAPEPMIIFLTDGEPTTGVTSESSIIKNVDLKNGEPRIPIFCLAFGTDADFKLLKRISLVTNGFARQIYEAADTALQLRNFYKEISSPVLSKVKFVYPPEQVQDETVTKVNFTNFFGGSELVVAGKLKDESVSGDIGVVEAQSAGGIHNYSVNHIDFSPPVLKTERNYRPLERLWVYMTIKELLNEAELIKAKSYLLDYKENVKPLELRPEEKALRLALKAVKEAVYSFFRMILDCLEWKLQMLQSLFQYISNDFVYVDSVSKKMTKNINETIKELAVKYSFVCPLTSLVVVKPGSLTDANVEPAVARPGTRFEAFGQSILLKSPAMANVLPLAFRMPPTTTSNSHFGMALPAAVGAGAGYSAGAQEKFAVETTDSSPSPLDQILWLPQVLTNDTLNIPGQNGTTDYLLGRNQFDDSFGNCTVGVTSGVCRHLEHCVIPDIINSFEVYYKDFFCIVPGNYAGICCPENSGVQTTPQEAPTENANSQTTPQETPAENSDVQSTPKETQSENAEGS